MGGVSYQIAGRNTEIDHGGYSGEAHFAPGIVGEGSRFYPLMIECPDFASHLVIAQLTNAPPEMELPDPPECETCHGSGEVRNPALEWQLQQRNNHKSGWDISRNNKELGTFLADPFQERWVAVGVTP